MLEDARKLGPSQEVISIEYDHYWCVIAYVVKVFNSFVHSRESC